MRLENSLKFMKTVGGAAALASLLLICRENSAYAIPRLSLMGGLNFAGFSMTNSQGATTSYDRKLGHGGGAELALPLSNSFEIAVGGLYLFRTFGGNTPTPVLQTREIQVPVVLRIFLDQMVSVQGGAYFSRFLGLVKVVNESTTPGGASSIYETSYDSLGFKNHDYGFIVGLNVLTDTPSKLGLDLRYAQGFANGATAPGFTAKDNEIQILISIALAGATRK